VTDRRNDIGDLISSLGAPPDEVVASAWERLESAIVVSRNTPDRVSGLGDSPAVRLPDTPSSSGGKRPSRRTTTTLVLATIIAAAIAVPAFVLRHPAASRRVVPTGPRPVTGPSVPSTTLSSTPVVITSRCTSKPIALHAWAVSVRANGQIAWSNELPDGGRTAVSASPEESAAAFGDGEGYFPALGIIHAIDLASGTATWSWVSQGAIVGVWVWGGTVVALTTSVSRATANAPSEVTGLDAKSGVVLWTTVLWTTSEAEGVGWNQLLLADGGLAVLTSAGRLQVIDLADGHLRWSVQESAQGPLAYADGLVLAQQGSALSAYSDTTGQLKWHRGGLPVEATVQVADGVALVIDSGLADHSPSVTALDGTTGRALWRFDPSDLGYVQSVTSGPAGLLVFTTQRPMVYLLDTLSGSVRWQASTLLTGMTPLVLRNDVIESETAVYGPSPTWLVDRNARTGVVRWRVESGVQPALLEGPLLIGVEQSARSGELVAYRLSDGGQAWRTTLPEDVLIAPDKIGGEMVVQPQTVIPSCN